MRKTLIALAGGVLLSLAGGYAIIWEGERRLARASAQAPEVVFVTAEHSIKNPNQHVDQLLARLRTTAPKQGAKEWGGLVADLLPPHHFIEAVAKTDPALASAFLRQDRQFFEHPAAAASLVRLFARYQAELDKQYAAWFENGPPSNALAWRYHGHPGGLLEPLERKCRQQGVRLRRLDQDWMQWQLRFHYEYTWQRALQSLTAGDAIGFVRLLFEHKTSLHRHQAMIEEKVRRLRVSALYKAPQIDQWQAGLVYIQQPSFTALSTYASCRDLSEETPVETAVQIGVLYVMEELARRARVAKNGDPYEALTFAQTTVSQVNAAQIIALWSKEGANRPQETNGPKRILHYLSQSGVLDLNDVQAERLLMWDEPLR